jgi:ATP-dependent DNA helicase RecQ
MTNVELSPKDALEQFFGFTKFKGDQEKIVQNVLDRKDTFVIMPTGGGKSLCYQLPALMSEGTAIVVSPLIALMKNQVDAIRGFSGGGRGPLPQQFLDAERGHQVKKDIRDGITKLLYVAPESLTKKENVEFLSDIPISFFAIDEAHCISEWGHDFRPEYRRLRTIFDEIKRVPMIALTATATEKVQEDILKNLDIPDANVSRTAFNRPTYTTRYGRRRTWRTGDHPLREAVRGSQRHHLLPEPQEGGGDRETLVVNGIKALPYHAGMDAGQRAEPPGPVPDGRGGCDRGHHRLRHGHRQTRCALRDPPRHSEEPGELLPGDRARWP